MDNIDKVFNKLMNMGIKHLKKDFKNHKTNDISKIIIETGMLNTKEKLK